MKVGKYKRELWEDLGFDPEGSGPWRGLWTEKGGMMQVLVGPHWWPLRGGQTLGTRVEALCWSRRALMRLQ